MVTTADCANIKTALMEKGKCMRLGPFQHPDANVTLDTPAKPVTQFCVTMVEPQTGMCVHVLHTSVACSAKLSVVFMADFKAGNVNVIQAQLGWLVTRFWNVKTTGLWSTGSVSVSTRRFHHPPAIDGPVKIWTTCQ